MSEASQIIEHTLRQSRPAALDPALLDRLDAAAAGVWCEPTLDESRLAATLAAVKPSALPPALASSLEATLSRVPHSDSPSIVPFPLSRPQAAPRRHRRRVMAAAAAAMFGALSAWWLPTHGERSPVADATAPARGFASATASTDGFVPAGFRRGLGATSDHGVVWGPDAQPHRVVRVVYRETVTLRDAQGRTCEVEQPRVEYILAPAKAD
ncbi:MAG: hypothetical protein FJ385_09590 [Verrucomicrobia bacterium]|jgi:hypothetical protein|nr:hypothetical protein [Verrucomicrobiota bacterium]